MSAILQHTEQMFISISSLKINAKDRASQHPLHRAATTGNNAFLQLLLNPPEGRPKTRLNTADRAGKPVFRSWNRLPETIADNVGQLSR